LKARWWFISLVSALSVGTMASARDICFVPMSKWQTRDAVKAMAEAEGWKVQRVKIDDGCYEIKARDKSGREIEVKVNPETLQVVDFEYEGDDKLEHMIEAEPSNSENSTEDSVITPGTKLRVIIK